MLQTMLHRITIHILSIQERCGRNTNGDGSWINMVRDIEIDFVFRWKWKKYRFSLMELSTLY